MSAPRRLDRLLAAIQPRPALGQQRHAAADAASFTDRERPPTFGLRMPAVLVVSEREADMVELRGLLAARLGATLLESKFVFETPSTVSAERLAAAEVSAGHPFPHHGESMS